MGKQQSSKRARQHRKEAKSAGLYANIGHPSHCNNWQRTAQHHNILSEKVEGGDYMETLCPRCKTKVEEKDNFCPKCGENLVEEKEVKSESTLLEEG